MNVGVRELKQRLSEYLERAARGEVIQVTDRGEPKAILGPLPGTSHLEHGVKSGWIAAPVSEAAPRRVRRYQAVVATADALADDRGW
ncbi:MAG: type II toxin-antitoxin system prevent-host-death family antitoxin [Deltaproteobacteria bacterium]|nr:type II toxin-antitoxin system prevent-host-death family antitoxin [Deltaproteobacteria bacterium]